MDSRSYVFILGSNLIAIAFLSWVFFQGQTLNVPIPSFCVFAFIVWLFLSNAWSTAPKQSWIDTLTWLFMFFLFGVAQHIPREFIIIAVSLPTYVMLPFFFHQKYKQKLPKPGSIFGNSNHIGSYLSLGLFAFLWLSIHTSPWFFIMTGIVGLSILLAYCRAAIFSTTIALTILLYHYSGNMFVFLIALAPILWGLYVLSKGGTNGENRFNHIGTAWRDRMSYYIAAFDTILRRPLFGWGLRTFRREQFFAVDRITKRFPEIYKKHPLPCTHRLHNDYLEITHETGFPGLILFLAILYQLNWAEDLVISTGLISVLIISLLFFPLREPHIAAPFWALAGTLSSPELTLPPGFAPVVVIVVLAISYMAYIYAYKKLVGIYWWMRIPLAKSETEWVNAHIKCHKNDPYNNQYLMYLYRIYLKSRPAFALDCMSRMNEHYDGSITVVSIQQIRPKFTAPQEIPTGGVKQPKKKKKKRK